jgi:hypothetical protein
LYPNLQFTAETEENNIINYLDMTIHRTPSSWKTVIYRKPIYTDTIIPYTSNHPSQHKYAAVKFLYNRLHTYNLQPEEYRQEENTIHNILYNNSFPVQLHKPQHPKPQEQKHLIPFKILSIGENRLVQSFFPLCEASLEMPKLAVVFFLRSCTILRNSGALLN